MYNIWALPQKTYRDRVDAGQQLAKDPRITAFACPQNEEPKAVILALPRGGVPVAYEIAKQNNLPLDLMLVRKIGIPMHEETAMGAIAMHDVVYLNKDFIRRMQISQKAVQQVIDRESIELDRRNKAYRGGRPYPDLKGKTVLIVDDGVATGATMKAAILAVQQLYPQKVVGVAPVGAPDSVSDLAKVADEMLVPHTPEMFSAVGQWYASFPQTDDKEVLELLTKAEKFGHPTVNRNSQSEILA
ncbi:hypothetical protein HK097_007306 [Rhizophlyctis rosea]|uniref:Phosphoribosyltransferase domain-containing protein n=1 Tax=Rhizophlyctis rosea TaxID=64517 RepID=A0AAD5SLH6_9FUNG|nr:hypothetical protein HK097_007306 [Rhizophlyctis rosea]